MGAFSQLELLFLTQTKITVRVVSADVDMTALGTQVLERGRLEAEMGWLTYALLVLGLAWLAQIAGTYFQMEHYRKVLGGIREEGREGYVGVGNAKVRFGKGVILILVVGENGIVREALRMRGMTVFARFKEAPDLLGMELDELRDEERGGPYDKGTMLAARRAIEQIDQIKAEKIETAVG